MPSDFKTTDFLADFVMDPEEYTAGYVQRGWLEGTATGRPSLPERYISWQYGDICLDGDFSADELRAIADHMEKFTP